MTIAWLVISDGVKTVAWLVVMTIRRRLRICPPFGSLLLYVDYCAQLPVNACHCFSKMSMLFWLPGQGCQLETELRILCAGLMRWNETRTKLRTRLWFGCPESEWTREESCLDLSFVDDGTGQRRRGSPLGTRRSSVCVWSFIDFLRSYNKIQCKSCYQFYTDTEFNRKKIILFGEILKWDFKKWGTVRNRRTGPSLCHHGTRDATTTRSSVDGKVSRTCTAARTAPTVSIATGHCLYLGLGVVAMAIFSIPSQSCLLSHLENGRRNTTILFFSPSFLFKTTTRISLFFKN